ncbi:Ig-like domain-containing protein [Clostridium felsineum]|uniref:major tail protein n=1 Tax=Clostridium felsineum TaxID=36839 RepID=UPI00214D2F79|nr:major tail protein [Clostridium felsineum]MCR3759150.1 Ig-like domain-containing protein [Clostridium felsineum]
MSNFISVENLYYAKEQSDVSGGMSTYSTPAPVGKSVKISVEPDIANGSFFADSALQEYATQFVSAKVSLETEVLPLSVVADILGHQLDGAGGINYNKGDHAPYVALMYRRKKVDGTYRYIKLFKCKFADGKEDGETVSNSLKIQDDTLEGVCFARYSDGNWKSIKDEGSQGYTDVSTTWFQSVNGTSTPLTITSSTPVDGATGVSASAPISLVFSTNLNASTVNTDNISLIKSADATAVAKTVAYNDATKTVTITPSSSLSATTAYILTANKNVKDTAGNTLANEYLINFTTT